MSLKFKLLGGIGFIFISGIISLGFGLIGSQSITDSVFSVQNDSFPALESANRLTEMVRITNNAILLSIDGDVDFEKDVLEAKEKFQDIIKKINQTQKDDKLIEIEKNYLDFVKDGIDFGRKMLQNNEDLPDSFINSLAEKRKLVTQSINKYLLSKTVAFENSLTKILNQSSSFNKMFLIVSLIQLFLVTILIITLRAVSRDTDKMNASVNILREGNLSKPFEVTRTDEFGKLQSAFEEMRYSLHDLIENLDAKVKERTHALAQAQKEIRDIFESINQGIFTFNLDLSLNSEHSYSAEKIFQNTSFQSVDIYELLNLTSEKQKKVFAQWVKMISTPKFYNHWEHFKNLCPATELIIVLDNTERIIQLEFQPILENGELKK